MAKLDDYTQHSTDWRGSLRQNNQRTRVVIFLFFLIYATVGFLIDIFLVSEKYPQASLSQISNALMHFQIFPIATTIVLAIAAVSLFVAYKYYDKLMMLGTDYREIQSDNQANLLEKQLYNVVEEMKIAAGLNYMPKVYIINAEYMNAFASGYSEKSAMVAITKGLIEKLNRDELQAVMAHEISHIRHLDIKLTVTASLLANMTLIIIDIFFRGIIYGGSNRRGKNNLVGIIILLRFLLPIITALLLLYLSRKRELMADAGCVELMRTNEPLARALMKISGDYQENHGRYRSLYKQQAHENIRRESYIFDPNQAGFRSMSSISDLFSTHPSLEKRLENLGFRKKQTRRK